MKSAFFLVLLIFFLTFPRYLSATDIVIFSQKGDYENFLSNLKQWKNKIVNVVTSNEAGEKKIGAFEVAYIKGHDILKPVEIIRDVDKHDVEDGKKWHRITLEASVAIPYFLPLATLMGPVGVTIEANGKAEVSKQYKIVMPDFLNLETDKDVQAEQGIDLKENISKIYKMISLPFNSDGIQALLPSGAEVSTVGERTLVVKVGPRLGTAGVAVKANTHVLLNSTFQSSLKVLSRVAGHTFVNYRVETAKQSDMALEAKLTIGLTFINTALFDNVLGSELITAKIAREKNQTLVYDFIYDLSYPTAQKSLAKALLGDLSPSQEVAVFRSNTAEYKGVSIIEKRSSLLLDVVKSGRLAFTAGEKMLVPRLQELVGQEFSGSFVDFSRNKSESTAEESNVNIIEEREEIASYKYGYDKNNELLLGLIKNNVSNIEIDSSAQLANVVSETQGLQEVTLNKFVFNYLYHEKKGSPEIVENFFTIARNVLGANQQTLANVIDTVRDSNHCQSKDAKVKISGIFYDRAIKNLLRYQPREVWVGIAKIAGYTPASAFRYETLRKKAIASFSRKYKKFLKKFSEQAIPFWEETADFNKPKAVAEKMRDLFVNLKGDPFLLELLIYLASADYRLDKDPDRFSQGVTVNMSLDTPNCQFNWGQRGSMTYSTLLQG